MMNRRDLLAGFFWLAIAVFVCFESIHTDLGRVHSPGPGFLPFWSAVVLGALSIILIIIAGRQRNWKEKITDLWKGLDWDRVAWVVVVLFLYPILLPTAGYLIATFGLMLLLLLSMRRSRIWAQGVTALAITVVSYVIFCWLLDVKLPKGPLGF
jgi:hypothetical protein